MRLRFSLREIFLLILCVAIGIASWGDVGRPGVSSGLTTASFPYGAECRFLTVRTERMPFDCVLQHRIGEGGWRDVDRFPRRGFSETTLLVYHRGRPPGARVSLGCNQIGSGRQESFGITQSAVSRLNGWRVCPVAETAGVLSAMFALACGAQLVNREAMAAHSLGCSLRELSERRRNPGSPPQSTSSAEPKASILPAAPPRPKPRAGAISDTACASVDQSVR